jgi:hypothetical protein
MGKSAGLRLSCLLNGWFHFLQRTDAMTKVQRFCVAVLGVIVLASAGAWQFAGAQGEKVKELPKWEYRVVASTTGAELNALGKDGWELVAVEPRVGGGAATFYFKRLR